MRTFRGAWSLAGLRGRWCRPRHQLRASPTCWRSGTRRWWPSPSWSSGSRPARWSSEAIGTLGDRGQAAAGRRDPRCSSPSCSPGPAGWPPAPGGWRCCCSARSAAVGVAAVAIQEAPSPIVYLPIAVGFVTWVRGPRPADRPAPRRRTAPRTVAPTGGRRGFLIGAARGRRDLGRARRARPGLRPRPARGRGGATAAAAARGHRAPGAPRGPDRAGRRLVRGRRRTDDFYLIHTAIALPTIEPEDWQLRIHGMVDREMTLSYQDLIARERTEAWVTLNCVSNPVGGDLIGNAWWSGVSLADLLDEAGVSADADALLQTSDDGWTCGTPLVGRDGRPRRDARRGDERPAAADRARLPGPHAGAGPLRLRVGDQVGRRHRGDPLRPVRGLLDRQGLGRAGAGPARRRGSTCPGSGPGGAGRRGARSAASPGSSTSASTGVEVSVDGGRLAGGRDRRAPDRGHLGAVGRHGARWRRATTCCGSGRSAPTARCRPVSSATRCPTAPPAGTRSSSGDRGLRGRFGSPVDRGSHDCARNVSASPQRAGGLTRRWPCRAGSGWSASVIT